MTQLIKNNYKNIAEGLTAFIVGGGPSAESFGKEKLQKLVSQNISATVNYNLQFYDDFFMWCTGDNKITRQFFEKDIRTYVSMTAGNALGVNHETGETKPVPGYLVKSMSTLPSLNEHINKNKNTYKIIFAQVISSQIDWSDGSQIYFSDVINSENYQNNNVLLGVEHKEEEEFDIGNNRTMKNIYGNPGIHLSLNMPEEIKYGNTFNKISSDNFEENVYTCISGGNVMSNLLQLLYFMGFEKVITIGWGDKGSSAGNNEREIFTWSEDEFNAIKVHNKYWGDRLKILSGGEILKENGEFKDALIEELENNKDQRDILNERIKNL